MGRVRGEGQRPYPGRSTGNASNAGNPGREARLNRQKSAKAIVPAGGRPDREGPNVRRGVNPLRSSSPRQTQKTPHGACSPEVAVKPQGTARGRSGQPAQGGASPRGEQGNLMEQVVARENMLAALKRVEQNGGAPGVDGVPTERLRDQIRGGVDFGSMRKAFYAAGSAYYLLGIILLVVLR